MDAAALAAGAMEGPDLARGSVDVPRSIDGCSSVIGRREEVNGLSVPESTGGNIMAYPELSRSSSQLSSFHCQDAPEEHKFSSYEGKQVRRRSGKMASSSNGCCKRLRMGLVEDLTTNETEANEVKEKSQMAKSKNGLNGKRADRRNGKVSVKSKYSLFSLKDGMLSFNSGAGGNSPLDTYDVTKHLDELTVKELLDDHYKSPSLAKDKVKKAANLNDNIVSSVRNACSILQRKKTPKIQSSAEMDDSYNLGVSAAPVCVDDASKNNNEKGDACTTDMSSVNKASPKMLDFQLCQPKDIIERVGLPPAVDLNVLLTDAAKSVSFPRDTVDSRGKQISHRANLAYADASTCHNKWVKIENTAALFGGRSGFLAEFESLNYDPNLVPVKSTKHLLSTNHAAPSASVNFSFIDFGSSSSATCSRVSPFSSEFGSNLKREDDAGDSPRSLAAAQTLCNIKQLGKQVQQRKMMWTSKPSDRTIKACRSKPDNKFREVFAKSELVISSYDLVKSKEALPILKKPKLLINEKGKDLLINEKGKDLNTITKGLVNWSVPRSSTQTPSKSYRDTHANVKSYNSFMMPPPSRVFDKACNSRQRLR